MKCAGGRRRIIRRMEVYGYGEQRSADTKDSMANVINGIAIAYLRPEDVARTAATGKRWLRIQLWIVFDYITAGLHWHCCFEYITAAGPIVTVVFNYKCRLQMDYWGSRRC